MTVKSDSKLAREHPRVFLGIYGIAGLAIAAACTWGFFALADEIPEHGWMTRIDGAVTTWLQLHGTETGEAIFTDISLLGAPILGAVLAAAAIFTIYQRNWRRLTALAITCGGGALLNAALKAAFHRARPASALEFHARSWSFPSGHAMDSLIIYGFLAHWAVHHFPRRRAIITIVVVALVGIIGYARVYLGVHYLSDVIAGYCAGLVWLWTCITGIDFAYSRRIGQAERES